MPLYSPWGYTPVYMVYVQQSSVFDIWLHSSRKRVQHEKNRANTTKSSSTFGSILRKNKRRHTKKEKTQRNAMPIWVSSKSAKNLAQKWRHKMEQRMNPGGYNDKRLQHPCEAMGCVVATGCKIRQLIPYIPVYTPRGYKIELSGGYLLGEPI